MSRWGSRPWMYRRQCTFISCEVRPRCSFLANHAFWLTEWCQKVQETTLRIFNLDRQAGLAACCDLSQLVSGFACHRNQAEEPPLHAGADYPFSVITSWCCWKENLKTFQRNEPSLGLIYSITNIWNRNSFSTAFYPRVKNNCTFWYVYPTGFASVPAGP